MKPLFEHQEKTIAFGVDAKRFFNTSDPGTGKTRSTLETFKALNAVHGGKLLVFAPLSILSPSWGKDIEEYLPGFNYAIAHGTPAKRKQALMSNAKIIVTNIDAVKWIVADKECLKYVRANMSMVCVDEFTHYKNQNSDRSKAVLQVVHFVPHLVMLSGTPIPNTVLDIWYPAYLVDNGKRLGNKYFRFRNQVCVAKQIGPDPKHLEWRDMECAATIVADMLKDITIRFTLEECISMPEHVKHTITLEPPQWLMKQYRELERTSRLEVEAGNISAVNAGIRIKKMLQLLSGAVYDAEGNVVKVHTERYDLVISLIEERKQCVVAYNYTHELHCLLDAAEKAGISFGYINGDVPLTKRNALVDKFQAGELKVLFIHPQSGSHGLTLTKGTSTIWCSPTYNAEHWTQFNHRIYRAGQTERTETIRIAYEKTEEVTVYEKLDGKINRMSDLLDLFNQFTDIE